MGLRRVSGMRRAEIIEAAARLFAQHGFRGATTRQIAREAGVAEGTLFRYFPTKRHLLLAMFEALAVSPIQRHLQALPAMEPQRWLEEFLWERLVTMRAQLPLMQALYQEIRTDEAVRRVFLDQIARPLLEEVRRMLAAELGQGRYRPLHPSLVMWVIWGALHGVTIFGMELDPELAALPPEQIARQLATLVLQGIEDSSQT
jgi:AcrR family transcriptional regulator